MTNAAIEAVLFDFAGTLFMPRGVDELVLAAAQASGFDLSPDDHRRLSNDFMAAGVPGGPYPEGVPGELRAIYERRDLSSEAHRAAYVGLLSTVDQPHDALAEAIYDQILEPGGWVPYADARRTVEQLRARGLRVGLISNVGFDIRPILRAHGFDEQARRCALSFELHAVKPDPEIFRAALRTLEAEPSATLMIGDHESADRGGEALGIRTVILPMTAPGSRHGLDQVFRLLE
jgi:HAD superfamily hydrolase (TIGR01509 family)